MLQEQLTAKGNIQMKKSIITLGIGTLALGTALFAATSGKAQASYSYCMGGAAISADQRSCSDGGIPVFVPDIVTAYFAKPVHPMTQAELRALDASLQRQAAALAQEWSRNGQLNAAQLEAIQNQSCLMVAAANSDITCVRQR